MMKIFKTIETPNRGYNGSILEINGRFLYVYRHEQILSQRPFLISACWLNENYDIISKQYHLHTGGYDPRIIKYGDRVIMFYTDHLRVHCGEIVAEEDISYYDDRILQTDFPLQKNEKNWLPFLIEDELKLIYSFSPHTILDCALEEGQCIKESQAPVKLNWLRGTIYGGSTPIRLGNDFISFFHSWKADSPDHRTSPRIYSIGAYIFSAQQPHNIKYVTKTPIWNDDFYSSKSACIHKVTFPMSALLEDNEIILSYGENDVVTKLAKFNLDGFLRTLSAC